MKRILFWIVLVPLAALLVVFSIANRGAVTVDLWPLPYQVDLPFFLIFLGALIVGFLIGGIYVAIAGAARRARRERAAFARKITEPASSSSPSSARVSGETTPQIPLKREGAE